MSNGRDIAAESLSDLLEVARVKQRQGMLRAEYTLGGQLEEGEIYLAAGQPIYARTGRLVGKEALDYLQSWRNIRFAFVTDTPRPVANLYSNSRHNPVTSPLPHFSRPLQTPRQSPVTGNLQWNPLEQMRAPEQSTPILESTPGFENMVPLKHGPERDIFSLGLSRRQRLIYFLIDGQRSVADLARTTNKTLAEIEAVVNELQHMGLIVF
jgi:hypothetical protein